MYLCLWIVSVSFAFDDPPVASVFPDPRLVLNQLLIDVLQQGDSPTLCFAVFHCGSVPFVQSARCSL